MIRKKPQALDPNIAEDNNQRFGLPDIGIPSEVLFNPALTHTQKILFGFIRNLAQSERGCWASNRYLAKLLGVEKQTISNAVSKLKDYLYIKVEFHALPNGNQCRAIHLNNSYQHIYAGYLKEVYKNLNTGVLTNIYPDIDSLIQPYKESTRKEVNEEVNEEVKKKYTSAETSSVHLNGYIVPSDFSKFMKLFPSHRKGSTGKALTAWEKICKPSFAHRPTWQRVRAAILRQIESEQWKKDKGKYIPLAATWLNGKRWLDDAKELKSYKFDGEEENNSNTETTGWIGNKFAN
jgi:hypothetical protein